MLNRDRSVAWLDIGYPFWEAARTATTIGWSDRIAMAENHRAIDAGETGIRRRNRG